jgi:hypothetical protein
MGTLATVRWGRIVLLLPLFGATTTATACINLDGFSGGATDAGPQNALTDGASSTPNDGAVSHPVDAGVDAPSSPLAFFDDFTRPDSPDVGNGWVMKHPPAFALTAGVIERRVPDSTDYDDNIVYRPVGESLLDVQVSIELHLGQVSTSGFPQVHARVQSSVTTAGQLDSYFIYIEMSTNKVVVARQHGAADGFTGLTTITVSPSFNTTDTFRLGLRVTGTSPVALTGLVERQVGNQFALIGQGAIVDNDPAKIVTPGTVGFSAGTPEVTDLYRYDNFTRTPL